MKIPNQETKHERFKRLATYRTNEVLKRLRVLGNCANKNMYEWNDEDLKKIFSTIEFEMKVLKSKFKKPKDKFTF
jgi:hypothetical protein